MNLKITNFALIALAGVSVAVQAPAPGLQGARSSMDKRTAYVALSNVMSDLRVVQKLFAFTQDKSLKEALEGNPIGTLAKDPLLRAQLLPALQNLARAGGTNQDLARAIRCQIKFGETGEDKPPRQNGGWWCTTFTFDRFSFLHGMGSVGSTVCSWGLPDSSSPELSFTGFTADVITDATQSTILQRAKDPKFRALLSRNASEALKSCGLDVPKDVSVSVAVTLSTDRTTVSKIAFNIKGKNRSAVITCDVSGRRNGS